MLTPKTFQKKILAWFDQHGRKTLPWQQSITPYRVWISEIMLQQTQVNTVIPYFNKFMSAFPTLQDLALAEEDEVLHLWTGLGYYTRARNLHKAARFIVSQCNGAFPSDIISLQQLPGVGRSTAGAILSIAFKQPAPILDGNVKRVLSRYAGIAGWPGDKSVESTLWQLASEYTPTDRCHDYAQAMMDLGATLCTRSRPACDKCPLQKTCVGFASGNPTQFPGKKTKKAVPVKTGNLIILQNNTGHILLEKRPSIGIWGGLWCLPEWDEEIQLSQWCKQNFGFTVGSKKTLPSFRHTFSHYHYDITPICVKVTASNDRISESSSHLWFNINEPQKIGLAAPIKKLLESFSSRRPATCSRDPESVEKHGSRGQAAGRRSKE